MPNIIVNETTPIYLTPYKSYVALLDQSGTSAPVPTILNGGDSNFLGNIVWTRESAGFYLGSLAGVFLYSKTATYYTNNIGNYAAMIFFVNDDDAVGINTYNSGGTISDSQLGGTLIEIRVYP